LASSTRFEVVESLRRERPDGSERLKVLGFRDAKVVDFDLSGLDAGMTRTLAVCFSDVHVTRQMQSTRNVDARNRHLGRSA